MALEPQNSRSWESRPGALALWGTPKHGTPNRAPRRGCFSFAAEKSRGSRNSDHRRVSRPLGQVSKGACRSRMLHNTQRMVEPFDAPGSPGAPPRQRRNVDRTAASKLQHLLNEHTTTTRVRHTPGHGHSSLATQLFQAAVREEEARVRRGWRPARLRRGR